MKLMETSRAPLQTQFGALGWGHGTFVPQVAKHSPTARCWVCLHGRAPFKSIVWFQPAPALSPADPLTLADSNEYPRLIFVWLAQL